MPRKRSRAQPEGEEFELENVLDCRIESGKASFLMKWKGYGPEENTWEPEENVQYVGKVLKGRMEKLRAEAWWKMRSESAADAAVSTPQEKRNGKKHEPIEQLTRNGPAKRRAVDRAVPTEEKVAKDIQGSEIEVTGIAHIDGMPMVHAKSTSSDGFTEMVILSMGEARQQIPQPLLSYLIARLKFPRRTLP